MNESATGRSKPPRWFASMMDLLIIGIALCAWSLVGGLVAMGFMVYSVK